VYKIELSLGKKDVGVVQVLIEGLDNAYSMMGTRKINDDDYVMTLQVSNFSLKELLGVITDCMIAGYVRSFFVCAWSEL
jgi:hypothetical protein